MNKEEIKRNLENYILKTNDRVYFTFETNTNQMAKDCLNTINELELELDIANKKIEQIEKYIKDNACYNKLKKECQCSFSSLALDNVLKIIGGNYE